MKNARALGSDLREARGMTSVHGPAHSPNAAKAARRQPETCPGESDGCRTNGSRDSKTGNGGPLDLLRILLWSK